MADKRPYFEHERLGRITIDGFVSFFGLSETHAVF